MYIKPKQGFKIRDPRRKDFLPDEGREVPNDDMHWQRLLRDGDIVVCVPATETKTEV